MSDVLYEDIIRELRDKNEQLKREIAVLLNNWECFERETERVRKDAADHAATHLCLKRHGPEERPETEGDYLVKSKTSMGSLRKLRYYWFYSDWEMSGTLLEWYSRELEDEG